MAKTKYNLEAFAASDKEWLLTFGGAYSNHILATAAAGRELGIKTIGVIRGDELDEQSNFVLRKATEFGMRLIFVSRGEYRLKNDSAFVNTMLKSNRFSTDQIFIYLKVVQMNLP